MHIPPPPPPPPHKQRGSSINPLLPHDRTPSQPLLLRNPLAWTPVDHAARREAHSTQPTAQAHHPADHGVCSWVGDQVDSADNRKARGNKKGCFRTRVCPFIHRFKPLLLLLLGRRHMVYNLEHKETNFFQFY